MQAISDGVLKGTKKDRNRLKTYLTHQAQLRHNYHKDRLKRARLKVIKAYLVPHSLT